MTEYIEEPDTIRNELMDNGFVDNYGTEAEAIAAWNTRAERTCKNVEDHKIVWFICSECGYLQKLSHTRSYCPNCGAKVRNE